MTGATGILIKLGVRLLIFGAVFFVMARRNPRVVIRSKWLTPLIALVFATLNTALYWALTPLLDLATLGAIGFLMPFIVNMLLLVGTVRIFEALQRKTRRKPKPKTDDDKAADADPAETKPWFAIEGIIATAWLACVLTVAHGVLWFALDYLPNK
jgi:hypothetical protein